MRSWLGPGGTAPAGPQARAHAAAPAGFTKGAIVFSGVCRLVPDGAPPTDPEGEEGRKNRDGLRLRERLLAPVAETIHGYASIPIPRIPSGPRRL
jgi:hypothetical protein